MTSLDELFATLEAHLNHAWSSLDLDTVHSHLHTLWTSTAAAAASASSSANSGRKIDILFSSEPSSSFARNVPPPTNGGMLGSGVGWKTATAVVLGTTIPLGLGLWMLYPHYFTQEVLLKRPLSEEGEVREAILVVGVEKGNVGEEIAKTLERCGFVVICTTSKGGDVEELEKRGGGKRKVVVLDESDPSSIAPFLRSFTSALTLHFPLHAVPTFSDRPLVLTGVINCLPLLHTYTPHLYPLESVSEEKIAGYTTALTTSILLTKSLLPFLRRQGGFMDKNGKDADMEVERRVVTLFSSATAAMELPFMSLQSAMDHALSSTLTALRRELGTIPKELGHPKITLQSVYVGLTKPMKCSTPVSPMSRSVSPSTVGLGLALGGGGGLEVLYAPALVRRMGGGRRRRSEMRDVVSGIVEVILGGKRGRVVCVGEGARKHNLSNLIPQGFMDLFIRLQDTTSSLLQPTSQVQNRLASNSTLLAKSQLPLRGSKSSSKPKAKKSRGRTGKPQSVTMQSINSGSSSNISPVGSSELDAISSGESWEGRSGEGEDRDGEEGSEGTAGKEDREEGGLGSFVSEAGWRDESVVLQRTPTVKE